MRTKYIQPGARNGRGLSDFIAEMSKANFTDQRPEAHRRTDSIRRAQGLTLYWDDGDIRKARTLVLDDDTVERLCEIAVDFRIGIGRSHPNKSLYLRTTNTTVAKVLEAIGKNFLVPDNVNFKPQGKVTYAD